MAKDYKIKFIKDWELGKKDDIRTTDEVSANLYVNNGYAVYLESEQENTSEIITPKPSQKPKSEHNEKDDAKLQEWLGLTEEEVESLNEEGIQKILRDQSNNIKALKSQKLKEISVVGSKIVKTSFRIEAIETGVALIKGWECECPNCHSKQTKYSPWIKTTEDWNACNPKNGDTPDWKGDTGDKIYPCSYSGSRGAEKFYVLEKKPLNDTGYRAVVVDTEVTSGNATPYTIFFPLKILPQNKEDLKEFELKLQMNEIEITGIIRVKQGSEKNIIDWFIEVTEYKMLKKNYSYDNSLLHKIGDEKRDVAFFQKYYAPEILQKGLQKKCHSLALLSPHKTIMPNGFEEKSTIIILEMGDPGVSKTTLAKQGFLKYAEDRANFIYVENATSAGLIMKSMKTKSGKWIVSLGELPKNHLGGVVCDGLGKLSQNTLAEMRNIEAEGIVESNKVSGHVSAPCLINQIQLGNLKNPVNQYMNKHRASYDLAINTSDTEGKFAGADRRRKTHILISGNDDIDTYKVSEHLIKKSSNSDFNDLKYWSNLNKFAWSREAEQFKWEDNISEYALEKVKDLNQKFKNFELEYGVLGKGGILVFIRQLPAVAILHESIEDENVIIKKEHADWLYDLYLDEFIDLGLSSEIGYEEILTEHAKTIIKNSSKEIIDILKLICKYGSQSAVERNGEMGRSTIWRAFRKEISYSIVETIIDSKGENKNEFKNYHYSFLEGSGRKEGNDFIGDNIFEPLNKRDGSLTKIGKILIKLATEEVKK